MYRRCLRKEPAWTPIWYDPPKPRPPRSFLSGLLPAGTDLGDLILLFVLLLLYMDTGDEEYLIVLLAVMM